MKIRPTEGLKNKYLPPVFLALFILIGLVSNAQINPVNGTVSNKSYSPAQAVPTDFRSQFYDASNFLMRDYNGTTEVLTYLTPSKFRAGHFPIYVHSGGTLNGNGTYSGGVTLVYWFKDGVLDANLVRWGTDTVNLSGFLQSANNLSDLQSFATAKANLQINNVDNTSDATKWAATATITNKTISGANNTITGLPNSALNNSTIGVTLGTSGSDFGVTGTPAPLGSNLTFNFPIAGPGVTGKLSGTDWSTFNNKLSNITGLLTTGTGYTLNGLGTSGSPYSLTITGGGASCLGCNADSLKNIPVDTTLRRNGYALTFDSTNHKWVLAPNGAGTGITALTGDGTASGSGTVAFTLTTVNGSPGSFGSASNVPVFTVNGKGLVTTVTNTPIQIAESQVTNLTTDLAGKQATGNYITGLTGDVVASGPGSVASTIQANAVTTGKINNNAVTYAKFQASSQAALLGTNAAGNFGEITLGTGLSFTGSVLNAAAGGSTNTNFGSGYRLAVPNTNNIKTLFCVGCTLDSTSNTNALTLTVTAGGVGTVTNFVFTSGGGINGSVATSTSTPTLSLTPSFTGLVQATSGVGFSSTTIGSGLSFSGGTLSANVAGAAGITGNVQVNKLGAFGVVPGFNADTSFGYVGTNLIQGVKQVVAGDTVQLGTIGTIFTDNFNRAALGANYTSSLSTFTLTFPSSQYMHCVGTFSSFTNYIERTLPINFVQDTLYATVVYQDTTSVSYGFGIAQVSQNSFYTRSVLMQFSAASSGTKGKSLVYLGDASGFTTATFTSTNVLAFTIGDTIDIKAARNDSTITMIKKNRRTGLSTTDAYAYLSNNVTVTPPAQLPNQGKWRLYFFGGTFDILNFSATSPDRTGGVVYVGNSILVGYNETNWSGRWVNYLHPSNRGIYDVIGGPGDRSAEYLNDTTALWLHNPKLIYWCGPENDCGASTSLTTFSANVVAFVNDVKAHNKPMVIVGGAPQTGKLMKPYNDTLQAIASRNNIPYINIYDTLRLGTDYNPIFSTDGVHPNTIGHIAVATQIAKQDPYFNYSIIRADNINNYTDANSRYVFWSPTSPYGLTVGQKYRDSGIYIHQSPTAADTGFVWATTFHGGARPDATLNPGAAWFTNNGGTTSATLAIQDLNASGYANFQFNDNLGNRAGFFYMGNSGAAFFPQSLVIETNIYNKSLYFIAGQATGRGTDYDLRVDSFHVKFGHLGEYVLNMGSSYTARSVTDKNYVDSAILAHAGGGGGISRISPLDSLAKSANGLQISGVNLVPQSADASFPGMLKATGSQTLGVTLTMPAPLFTGLTSSGPNDSVLTVDPSTGQVHRRAGTTPFYFANALTASTVIPDSAYWGGTLNQTTTVAQAGFGVTISGGQFTLGATGGTRNWNPNNGLSAGIFSVIPAILNDNVTSASTTVTNAFATGINSPTLTAANTSVTYTNAFSLFISGPPSAGTNVSITNSYGLGVSGGALVNGPVNASLFRNQSVQENSGNVTMGSSSNQYIATGTTATYTLPSLAASLGVDLHVKNAGSGTLTVQRAGSDNIYDTGSVTSITIAPGASRVFVGGSAFWYVE